MTWHYVNSNLEIRTELPKMFEKGSLAIKPSKRFILHENTNGKLEKSTATFPGLVGTWKNTRMGQFYITLKTFYNKHTKVYA